MIVALLLAAAVAAPAPAEDEIVIIARKVDSVAITLGRDGEGHTTCGISKSSGDLAIDEKLCLIAAKCVKPGPVDEAAVHSCVEARKPKLVAALAKASRQAESQP